MGHVLVTGADGFIGKRLVARLLREGFEVTVLLHRKSAFALDSNFPGNPGVRVIHGDVTDAESLAGKLEGVDFVAHLAGCTIPRFPGDLHRVNCLGTVNVARECLRNRVTPRFFFVSSLAAGGPSECGVLNTEGDLARPISKYGKSKWDAEQALQALSAELPICVIRPPSVLGEDDPYLLKVFRTAAAGWVVLAGLQACRYSFVHVDDLVEVFLFLIKRPGVQESFETFYATEGPPMTFREMGTIVRQAIGFVGEPKTLKVPMPICQALGWINSGLAMVLNHRPLLNIDKIREARGGDWCCSGQRLLDAGFIFQVSIEERIRQTAISYCQKGWLKGGLLTPHSSHR